MKSEEWIINRLSLYENWYDRWAEWITKMDDVPKYVKISINDKYQTVIYELKEILKDE